jgi:hypothetical protein
MHFCKMIPLLAIGVLVAMIGSVVGCYVNENGCEGASAGTFCCG